MRDEVLNTCVRARVMCDYDDLCDQDEGVSICGYVRVGSFLDSSLRRERLESLYRVKTCCV